MKTLIPLSLFCLLLFSGQTSFGQKQHNFHEGDQNFYVEMYYQLEITPSKTSTDSTRTFVRDDFELINGNAAIHYYRACLKWHSKSSEVQRELSENWDEWYLCELKDFPQEAVAKYLAQFRDLFENFGNATWRKECDWDFGLEQISFSDYIGYDLSEVQTLRTISRLNRLNTRLEISRGNFAEAHHSIMRNFKLAFDVSKPLMVCGIVGESIAATALQSVHELSQVRGSHSSLAALQSLPNPIIDFRPMIRFEQGMIERSFGFLNRPEDSTLTAQEWRQEFIGAMETMDSFFQDPDKKPVEDSERESRTAILLAQLYPIAKQELLRNGWEKQEIDSMPVGQVVAIQTRHVWDQNKNLMNGFRNLPIADAMKLAQERFTIAKDLAYDEPMVRGDFPLSVFAPSISINTFPATNRRINYQIAILQNVEQLREFASEYGELPNLEQFKSLALARDPATNLQFEYEKKSATEAILQSKMRTIKNYPKQHTSKIRMDINLKK